MGAAAKNHHVTGDMALPLAGIGAAPPLTRSMPVAAIYELKKQARPEIEQPAETASPKVGRGSVFFRIGKRSVEDDPFLQRLARLK